MRPKLILFFLSVLFSFLIIEIALRYINYYPNIINMDVFIENDNELLPYKLKPGYTGYYLNREVNINSQGHRIVSPDTPPPDNISDADSKTILVLGDSVVFGHGLKDNETIASQLQSKVNELGLDYKIDNIGIPCYTSWNEYEALKKYFTYSTADIVVLFYVLNDITMNNNQLNIMKEDQKNNYTPITRFLYRNIYSMSIVTELFGNINYYYNNTRDRLRRNVTEDGEEYNRSIAKSYRSQIDYNALLYSVEALSGINELSIEKGFDFYVVIAKIHTGNNSIPSLSNETEDVIGESLDEAGLKKIILDSHIKELTIEQFRRTYNDPHPSALTVSYISDELLHELLKKQRD